MNRHVVARRIVMKTDLYTKCVLTVIAICLAVLGAERLIRPEPVLGAAQGPVAAQNTPQRVIISGIATQGGAVETFRNPYLPVFVTNKY
jgi:hypothetical protein